jgi:serine/threonine-protein kinase
MSVNPGDVLAGKFRIERVLGQGGMGVVVAAYHLQLDERVALKFLLPDALQNAEAVARFAREARAAVKIKSEHVARVSDVGTLETGAPYMVMEYLEGRDLSAYVRESGPLPPSEAADYVLQACEALAEAHALGIVHRDLKPANLFLTRRADGTACVKVLDFGISKLTNPGASDPGFSMTRTQAIMGSPLYMSPEQMASSRQVDGRTDIWAIGAILYELMTGRVPFEADTMPQLCAMILQEPPRSMRDFRGDVPEPLHAVVLRCLAKDRNQRYQNVAELANALAPFASRLSARSAERISRVLSAAGISTSAVSIPNPSVPPPATGTTLTQTGSSSKLPLVLSLVAVIGVVAIGVAAFLFLRVERGATAESVNVAPSVAPAALVSPPSTQAEAPPVVNVATAVPEAAPSPSTTPSPAPVAEAPKAAVQVRAGTARPVTKAPAKAPTPTVEAPKAASTPTVAKKPVIDPLEGRR